MRPAVMRSIAGLVPYQGKGEQNGRAILDEEKVRRILRRNADGSWLEKTSALASEFGGARLSCALKMFAMHSLYRGNARVNGGRTA